MILTNKSISIYSIASVLSVLVLLCSCSEPEKRNFYVYDGPVMEIENVHLFYNDSAGLLMELKAPRQLEMKNKDQSFPEGILLKYYNKNREVINTIRADSAYNVNISGVWYAYRDVQVRNLEKQETLFTEELIWKTTAHTIETDKFVRIETPDQVLKGEGLIAKEDFSSYEILSPVAEINVD